jgi:Plasmid pRiA4b ORF-3-like protein
MLEPKRFRRPLGNHGPQVPSSVVRLRIVLLEVIPPVWRRVQVPANLTLRRLHSVLQCAMGWPETESHLFRVGPVLYGKPANAADPLKDSRWATVGDIVALGTPSFSYELGAMDRWEHEVRIEAVTEGNEGNQRPVCLAGERACPPEDCGGPEDYVNRVADLERPSPVSAGQIAGTLRPKFDPDRLDLEAVNRALSWLR